MAATAPPPTPRPDDARPRPNDAAVGAASGLRVLVVVASRHGATREIAQTIATGLERCAAGRRAGMTAVLLPADRASDPARYDAVVLGSAVYAGRWLEPASRFATAHAGALRTRPVWLFSSGPIGQPPFPADEPHDVGPVRALIGARDHRVFPGRLEPRLLGFGERAVVTAMRAPVGDFRDWTAVGDWAHTIAEELAPAVHPLPV